MRDTMDALSPVHPARQVVFMKAALSSPVGRRGIARMGEAAATDEARRSFRNNVRGETWIENGEAPDRPRVYERRGGCRYAARTGEGESIGVATAFVSSRRAAAG